MDEREKDIIESEQPKENYFQEDENRSMEKPEQIDNPNYRAAGKLEGKVAIITGADSGIGAATAIAFAKEGANLTLVDIEDREDAERTRNLVEQYGAELLWITGDVGDEELAERVVRETVEKFGNIDILVNNAAQQVSRDSILDITASQLDRTFRTNIFSMFYFVKAALPYLNEDASIINTSSITAYKGQPTLLDYSSTKGAIIAFTRSLAQNEEFTSKRIRVNAVAPGPIWTPLIPATTGSGSADKQEFGGSTPLKRPGESYELAPAYVYLASSDSSYVTGQTIHVNGGSVVNG
ncbi:glucose 1-dehydrogenase [Jeotgalibaca caeni]|uniref:glucose 1-dehydrogenase n=1 Tax=Jeotgalibaca caeni TaxID=3028623 RepID=UPI00237D527A|nr:glucose 1-dehydrogenase [Jeotgalibaca caeni]MDE1549985.1 glucose 1-dehydrogenase [Jeotgalibaca caeni]